jgi:hypothetical protein
LGKFQEHRQRLLAHVMLHSLRIAVRDRFLHLLLIIACVLSVMVPFVPASWPAAIDWHTMEKTVAQQRLDEGKSHASWDPCVWVNFRNIASVACVLSVMVPFVPASWPAAIDWHTIITLSGLMLLRRR